MKKYNYKYVIGFIIGIILFGEVVYAAVNYSANVFFYDKTRSTLNSTDIQGAIDELATKYANLTVCPNDKICLPKKSTLEPGDYISYTPTKTSYTTDTSKTGYTSSQTINPSELNLWRVLSINGDGTVDIISEYASSTNVVFSGKEGYKNLVGYLNVLASQYETSGITIGSRHYGYKNQTEYITSDTYFVNPAPWTCSTGGTCTPDPDNYEAYGGGDAKYTSDYYLVNKVLATNVAHKVGSSATNYWMASRYYRYGSATYYYWNARIVVSNGYSDNVYLYYNNSGSFLTQSVGSALRPIVTLKSGFSYSGIGSKEYPMEIIS